jgi:hypothetical protein
VTGGGDYSLFTHVTVETEPTSVEMREVNTNGEVVSLKRPVIAVHFADKTHPAPTHRASSPKAALTAAELGRRSTYPCDWLSHESVEALV